MRTFTRVRTIAFLLRIVSLSAILSGLSFFFPKPWIDSFVQWWGTGPMPEGALMRYVLWGGGCLQVGIGAVVWVIARDVVRHQAVVVAVLVAFLVAAPTFYFIDAVAGLPRSWCWVDFGCCFLAGIVPLLFCLWPTKQSRDPVMQPTGASHPDRDQLPAHQRLAPVVDAAP
jgi:hypothetical protein